MVYVETKLQSAFHSYRVGNNSVYVSVITSGLSHLTLVSSMKIMSLLSSLRNFTTFSYSCMNSVGAALGVKKGDKREQSLLFFRMVSSTFLHSDLVPLMNTLK